MLIGIKKRNRELVKFCFSNLPACLFDCDNCFDGYSYQEYFDFFEQLYILEIELLYKFRKATKKLTEINTSKFKCVVITNFKHLFDHGDIDERIDVLEDAWNYLKLASSRFDIFIGIENYLQYSFAKRYCDKVII